MKNQLTLVTALFDLGRGDLSEGFSRGFEHYLECFEKLLKVDYPMVIFAPEELNDFINERRDSRKTKILNRSLDDLRKFPFYDKVQELREKESWYNQAGWLTESPQAKLELYNPLVMSKQFFMNDSAIHDFFRTKYFMWIDAGIANTIGDPPGYLDEKFGEKMAEIFSDNKMHYLCFPYEPATEIHGFEKEAFYRAAGATTEYVARGGIFGGSKDALTNINAPYYATLNDTIHSGYMGTEESIFTLLTYTHPQLCTKHMIESNGLVYKFLEEVQQMEIQTFENLMSIYVLTYNLPKQFKIWAEKFEENLEDELKDKVKKYVINNSVDEAVKDEYDELFHQYGFTELKYDNIGICGARQVAAEHFAEKNETKYMIFFEDDMLLCGETDKNRPCKNGFPKYIRGVLEKSIDIMAAENLDYLKLSFSEFFGDNHTNWAWFNVPHDRRELWFKPTEDKSDSKKVEIFYTGCHQGLSYSVGEYHYCNWPILFNHDGNRKVFLDTKFEHKYEQTWMSFVMQLLREKKVRAGCLLASPITHYRRYHYGKENRKENEHN
jgi:hypothetical protein